VNETRRHAIKLLGTVGLTCAFPFAGDELYGQHVHVTLAQTPATGPYTPAFFDAAEYATLSSLANAIIPATATPGAVAAGVPEYIDQVVSLNAEHQTLARVGLAWLERQSHTKFSRAFTALEEAQQVELLQPLSDAVDRQQRDAQRARFRTETAGTLVYYVAVTDKTSPPRPAVVARPAPANDPDLPVRLFRLIKNLTADGYYTSRVGLLEELGYTGNTMLARFPECSIREQ
jgi:glucoside 3-dehydrogenase (cytochrome c) hitch-hiker subunit